MTLLFVAVWSIWVQAEGLFWKGGDRKRDYENAIKSWIGAKWKWPRACHGLHMMTSLWWHHSAPHTSILLEKLSQMTTIQFMCIIWIFCLIIWSELFFFLLLFKNVDVNVKVGLGSRKDNIIYYLCVALSVDSCKRECSWPTPDPIRHNTLEDFKRFLVSSNEMCWTIIGL